MRLLHTADWHLGQTLHGEAREFEHDRFLEWLGTLLVERAVDVLAIAGDVFDGQNPPVSAQRLLYQFLARARRLRPELAVVIIAGNHDSGGRLEAPSPLLEELGVRVVGGLRRGADGALDVERLLVPLAGGGWCAAIPYLRPGDLPALAGDEPEIAGVRAVHEEIFAALRARRASDQPVIALGHCYMAGGQVSDLSERKILRGNLHALPVELFPADIDYVALGHLHRAQSVGGREAVRYSGSPLPLALDEAGYHHQVVLVEFQAGRLAGWQAVPVPRFVEILRLAAPSAEAVPALLAALPEAVAGDGGGRAAWPLLELTVRLDQPAPGLRARVEEAVANKAVRLVRLALESGGHGRALAGPAVPLSVLAPEEVFRRCWARGLRSEPSPAHLAAFHDLLETVHGQEDAE